MRYFDFRHVKGDFFGGITAGIVALPLALAFGEASGAGPIAGIWGAIFVGFFAALLGGTQTQISGPTGPMIVVFAGVYESLAGAPGLVFATVVLAGAVQILFGLLKFGQYIRLVPYPVISGFMSGIGVIIILLQLPRLFGHEPSSSGTIAAMQAVPHAVSDLNPAALVVGLVTLLVIFLWPKVWSKYLPGVLAALLIGTLTSFLIQGAPILGDIPTGLPEFLIPSFSRDSFAIVVEGAIILAVLGAIDSLLTSLVADNMTRTRHESERELIGQGVGNMIAGFFQAIPGAGATMRTVVNIRTGGMTRLSGMIHGLLLLAVMLSLAPLAAMIPHAVLAGILVKVGYDIIDFTYLKRAHRGPRLDLALMALVLGLTVFVDLITAVAAGVVLAALAFIKSLANEQLKTLAAQTLSTDLTPEEQVLMDSAKGRIMLFDFGGPLSFGAAADLGHQVREHARQGTRAIILDFSRVPFIDVSSSRAVETIVCDARQAGKMVYMTGVSDKVQDVLTGLDADHCLQAGARHDTRLSALQAALEHVKTSASDSKNDAKKKSSNQIRPGSPNLTEA